MTLEELKKEYQKLKCKQKTRKIREITHCIKAVLKHLALGLTVVMCIATLQALPTGKIHNQIHILGGIIEYADGSKDYSIIAYTELDGQFLIKELPYSRTVNIELLADTLLNQAGFTFKQIKQFGYAIDHKRRHLFMTGNIVTIRAICADDVKWTYSQKLTDSILLVVPVEADVRVVMAKKTEKRNKKLTENGDTLLEKLKSNKELKDWAEKQ
jgi:hypothetical protein